MARRFVQQCLAATFYPYLHNSWDSRIPDRIVENSYNFSIIFHVFPKIPTIFYRLPSEHCVSQHLSYTSIQLPGRSDQLFISQDEKDQFEVRIHWEHLSVLRSSISRIKHYIFHKIDFSGGNPESRASSGATLMQRKLAIVIFERISTLERPSEKQDKDQMNAVQNFQARPTERNEAFRLFEKYFKFTSLRKRSWLVAHVQEFEAKYNEICHRKFLMASTTCKLAACNISLIALIQLCDKAPDYVDL
ncbi:hypothetical protein WN51_13913 [Melipona quadrifasciata]|uniref:Uncharacterized protein n=1 Tax=Melipona quadrifasciata TaxID=166423 RepID=A0A0M8ZYR2_9HYME|nr:hypothetical protein WN51_13913 [Melipona quadrifasciata]